MRRRSQLPCPDFKLTFLPQKMIIINNNRWNHEFSFLVHDTCMPNRANQYMTRSCKPCPLGRCSRSPVRYGKGEGKETAATPGPCSIVSVFRATTMDEAGHRGFRGFGTGANLWTSNCGKWRGSLVYWRLQAS